MIIKRHLLRSSVSLSHSSISIFFKLFKSLCKRLCNVVLVRRPYVYQQPDHFLQSLWDALVLHSHNMTKPALAEGGLHSGKTSTSQHFFVGNLMFQPVRRRHRWWKLLIFFSCIADWVHVSLPYSRVLKTQIR